MQIENSDDDSIDSLTGEALTNNQNSKKDLEESKTAENPHGWSNEHSKDTTFMLNIKTVNDDNSTPFRDPANQTPRVDI